jgi:hypothetical protein
MKEDLPSAPMPRRPYGPTTRVSVSMTEKDKEILEALAEMNETTRSEIIRSALYNQHYLESVKNDGGQVIIENGDGSRYDFSPS